MKESKLIKKIDARLGEIAKEWGGVVVGDRPKSVKDEISMLKKSKLVLSTFKVSALLAEKQKSEKRASDYEKAHSFLLSEKTKYLKQDFQKAVSDLERHYLLSDSKESIKIISFIESLSENP